MRFFPITLYFCLFNFISHRPSHSHYSLNHGRSTLTGRRPSHPNTPATDAHARSPSVDNSPPLPVLRDPHVYLPNLGQSIALVGKGVIRLNTILRHRTMLQSIGSTARIVTQSDLEDRPSTAINAAAQPALLTPSINSNLAQQNNHGRHVIYSASPSMASTTASSFTAMSYIRPRRPWHLHQPRRSQLCHPRPHRRWPHLPYTINSQRTKNRRIQQPTTNQQTTGYQQPANETRQNINSQQINNGQIINRQQINGGRIISSR